MKMFRTSTSVRRVCLAGLAALACSVLGASVAPAGQASPLIDDFANQDRTTLGAPRLIIDDQGAGSQSTARQTCADGVLRVEGQLKPGRGTPAFISVPLLLNAEGTPLDASNYTGVRLKVRVLAGSLAVQVASAPIDNYDYHISAPLARHPSVREIHVPFKDLKRAWSPQTPLDLKQLTSVNLVSFGLASEAFAYTVEEIAFY
jgi:hypothetical protein